MSLNNKYYRNIGKILFTLVRVEHIGPVSTRSNRECLKKHVEDDFCHGTAFAFYFEIPQNRKKSFSIHFLFSNWSRSFFQMFVNHFLMFEIYEMPRFSYLILKMETDKEPKMKINCILNANTITWQNHLSRAFYFPCRV